MRKAVFLIIITLTFVFSVARGQTRDEIKAQSYNMILAADSLLSECKNYESYKSVYQHLMYGFSELGANMVLDYMQSLPYFEFLATDEAQQKEIKEIAELYDRVRIGANAPHINDFTIEDKDFDLYNIESKYTIIVFWSYACPHCQDLIKEISHFMKGRENVALVTVCVSDELKNVKRFLKKSHLEKYYNICDGKRWDSPIIEDYAVEMTPSMFLLDSDKKIILKPFSIEDILNNIEL